MMPSQKACHSRADGNPEKCKDMKKLDYRFHGHDKTTHVLTFYETIKRQCASEPTYYD
jgi:hypothetical protein